MARRPASTLAAPATVDASLNFRLDRLLASSGVVTTRLCEGRYGITRREWRLLALLADYGAMSPSGLAERGQLPRGRVSRLVADLVAKGLVAKSPRATARQRAELALTPAGQQLHAALFPQSVAFQRQVLSVLSPAELAAFEQALDRLTAQAEALAQSLPTDAKADRRHGGSRRSAPQPARKSTPW